MPARGIGRKRSSMRKWWRRNRGWGTALLPDEDTSAKNRFGPECRRPSREVNDAMNAENMRINLRYDQADLKSLLRYAKAHDIERGGRYDIRMPPRLNIWTHTWIHPGCRAESSLMFSMEFDWSTASLMSVRLLPGYNWQIFLDELARLEERRWGIGSTARVDVNRRLRSRCLLLSECDQS